MDMKKALEDVRKFQKKHFRVKVERDHLDRTSIVVRETHNGYQWSVIQFLDIEEMENAISVMQKYVDKHKKEQQ